MSRVVLAFVLLIGGMSLCSCSESSDGIKKPTEVTPPPPRVESSVTPVLDENGEPLKQGEQK